MITDECLSTHTKANLHKLVKMSVKTNVPGAYVMKTMNSCGGGEGGGRCRAAIRPAPRVLIMKISYLTIISSSIRTCEYYTLSNFWRLADCVIRYVINKGAFPVRPVLIFSCARGSVGGGGEAARSRWPLLACVHFLTLQFNTILH